MTVRRILAVAAALCLSALIAGSAMAQKEAKKRGDGAAKKDARERTEKKSPKQAGASLGAFQVADADGNGKISKAELIAMIGKRFAAADKDGDGDLDAKEIKALGLEPQLSPEDRAAAAFAKMDKNGDGLATPDEMPESMAGRVEKMDKNGDGALSLEEMSPTRGPAEKKERKPKK